MGLIRHNLPLFITLAVVFFVLGFVIIGAFLWQRVGLIRASLFGALVLWGGLVLAFALSPKRRYRGELALPRSCDVTVLPTHVVGAITAVPRIETVLLWLPLGALLVLAARGAARVVLGAALAAAPLLVELLQWALPGLRRSCASNDVYDSWTGLVLGVGVGVGLLVLARRSPLAQERSARHRDPEQRPPNPFDVVRVLWPPLEPVEERTPVTPRSTFVPSGAKPGSPAPQPTARQARRQRAEQIRQERRLTGDRRSVPDRRGRHSKDADPPMPQADGSADQRSGDARRALMRRASDRTPSPPA